MQILERKPIALDAAAALAALEHETVKNAESELGYRFASSERRRTINTRRIAAVFEKAGLNPFTDDSVRAYQSWQVLKDVLKYFALTIPMVPAGFVLTRIGFSGSPDSGAHILMVLGGVGLVVGGAIATVICVSNRPQWRQTELAHFSAPVPTFVLMTATSIMRLARTDGLHPLFQVDYLQSRSDRRAEAQRMREADPFLVVSFGEDSPQYYVEVWDEPGFERPRPIERA